MFWKSRNFSSTKNVTDEFIDFVLANLFPCSNGLSFKIFVTIHTTLCIVGTNVDGYECNNTESKNLIIVISWE